MQNFSPSLFLIDLDNTIIYTDRANNLAYEKAIKELFPSNKGISLFNKIKKYSPKRITRGSLLENTYLDEHYQKQITTLKEYYYDSFLFSTISNQEKIDKTINVICQTNRLPISQVIKIIVTNCSEKRATSLLKYHHLSQYSEQIIYCNGSQHKFDIALSYLNDFIQKKNIAYQHIFIFDDDIIQIKNINQPNIPKENIIHYSTFVGE